MSCSRPKKEINIKPLQILNPPSVKKIITRTRKKVLIKCILLKIQKMLLIYITRLKIYHLEKLFLNLKLNIRLKKLVENVFNTFKFTYFETGPLDVQKETVSHLVANMHKYDKAKGRAFAYFSIVAKHYLIFLNNSNYKRFNSSVEIGEDREDHVVQLQSEDKYYKQAEMSEFMRLMIDYWEQNVGKSFLNKEI